MATNRRPGRPKAQLPECYHQGFLEKRSFKDKTSRKLWVCLCGNSLFFFQSNKDNDYVEKQELAEFISVSDDSSHDHNLEAARFQLHLKEGIIQMTAPSLEARELWKGFISCVAELSVPSSLNLLPGQLHQLKEVVEKEKDIRKPLPTGPAPASAAVATATVPTPVPPIYMALLAEMPACFQPVSRAEAEVLLEGNQDKGNLLLRQGRDGSSLAVSTRQDFNGPVFRHYRVTRQHEGGFAIAVENPIPCETLQDVISCLVQKTGGTLKPLVLDQAYEKSITFIKASAENGEKSLESALSCPEKPLPPVAPKPAPRSAMPPVQPKPSPDEDLYLNASDEETVVKPSVPPRAAARSFVHQCSLPADINISSERKKVPLFPPNWQKSRDDPRCSSEAAGSRPRSCALMPTAEFMPHNVAEELKIKVKKRTMSDLNSGQADL